MFFSSVTFSGRIFNNPIAEVLLSLLSQLLIQFQVHREQTRFAGFPVLLRDGLRFDYPSVMTGQWDIGPGTLQSQLILFFLLQFSQKNLFNVRSIISTDTKVIVSQSGAERQWSGHICAEMCVTCVVDNVSRLGVCFLKPPSLCTLGTTFPSANHVPLNSRYIHPFSFQPENYSVCSFMT